MEGDWYNIYTLFTILKYYTEHKDNYVDLETRQIHIQLISENYWSIDGYIFLSQLC